MFGWFRSAPTPPAEEQLRVTKALLGYPPYAPPDWDRNPDSFGEGCKIYKEFFLDSRETRLQALGGFFAKFDVLLNLDDTGLMAVSAWLPQYADLLVDDLEDDNVKDAYEYYAVPWIERLTGLNPIFDLGIYYAECLWHRRTKLEWIVYRGPESGVAVHLISGLPGGKSFDPIRFMYVECRNIRNSKRLKQKRIPLHDDPSFLKHDSFYRRVLSQTPPGRRSRKRQ
jgi:hypothetical protein